MVPKSRRTAAPAPITRFFVVVEPVSGNVDGVRMPRTVAILYVCSKVGCFLVSRPVVRSGRWC